MVLITAAAIGAGLKAASSIIGGAKQKKIRRQKQKLISDAEKYNDAWFNQRYNEDFTMRADAQKALEYAREQAQKFTDQARGAAAVSGATAESVAQQKAAANEMIGDTTSNIAAQAENYKSQIEQQYLAKRDELLNRKLALLGDKSANTQRLVEAGQSLGDSISRMGGKGIKIG